MRFTRRLFMRVAAMCGVIPMLGPLAKWEIAAVATAQSTPAPTAQIPHYLSPLDLIEDLAQRASSGNADAVLAMTDAALNCSIFADSAHSIRDRVYRAEIAFRNGLQKSILEIRLVKAINEVASLAFAPEALKTSEDQVHMFRVLLNTTMPHFIGISNEMSPAEVVFVTGFLTQQKLRDPGFKLDSGKVAAGIEQQKKISAGTLKAVHKIQSNFVLRVISPEMEEVQNALYEQLPHEWSLATILVHLFLDRAGLRR